MLGAWFVLWAAWQQPIPQGRRWLDVYLIGWVGALLGARLGYVLLHTTDYLNDPAQALNFWYGELSWPGAILGGAVASWLAAQRWRVPWRA
ncbi:MAG: hypothetical protein HC915_17935 [Anaerolineae bacterium]|nr:hypothetical protein [Anaerolineae bacterium]